MRKVIPWELRESHILCKDAGLGQSGLRCGAEEVQQECLVVNSKNRRENRFASRRESNPRNRKPLSSCLDGCLRFSPSSCDSYTCTHNAKMSLTSPSYVLLFWISVLSFLFSTLCLFVCFFIVIFCSNCEMLTRPGVRSKRVHTAWRSNGKPNPPCCWLLGWVCKIHRLHLCIGVRPPPKNVLIWH